MVDVILNDKRGYRYDGPLDCLLDELNLCNGKYLELLEENHIVGIPHDKISTFIQIEKNKIKIEVL